MKHRLFLLIIFLVTGVSAGYFYIQSTTNIPQSKNEGSPKTVVDYFVEYMNVSRQEAEDMAADGVILRVSKDATGKGIAGNLSYYGFIDNEETFITLLETVSDTTPGREEAITVGKNTIDIHTNYYLNYGMTEEEIADTLLNKGNYDSNFTQYSYLFMPGGPGTESRITPVPEPWGDMTLTGEYTCLPHRDTSGPVTLECAFGIKSDNGFFYALDSSPAESGTIQTGQRISVEGNLVPIEAISSNIGRIYNIKGVMQVKKIEPIDPVTTE